MAEHQTTETPGESKGMVDMNALPADIREQLLAAQKSLKETTAPNTPKIGVKEGGGRYRLGDDTFKELTGIIVAVRHANKWFDKDYTPGQANPAECVATVPLPGTDVVNSKLVPLPEVTKPPHTDCRDCPKFQWKSSTKGTRKGKACSEYLVLAVYFPSLSEKLFIMEMKKGRASDMDSYLHSLVESRKSPLMVTTMFEIGVDDNVWNQRFTNVGDVSYDQVVALARRVPEAESMIYQSVINSLDIGDGEAIGGAVAPKGDTAGKADRPGRKK